ncbi:MAG TPA: HAD-IA family hydrolase [Burkholderiales bacterium]|nr:HAD-IA family hydrolase [Burkholderiales bacterium]
MTYRLLVFDWDGTIIDSAATIAECIRDASRELGLEVPDRERASHVIGLGLHDAMRIAVPALPAERYPEFVASYREHFVARKDTMQLFEGMRQLLEGLSRKHLLAIATGKSRRGLDRDLEFHHLTPLFAASRCADETNPKPHPAMLMEIMEELAVQRNSSLMIGDTSHDMEMARAAGVNALAVTYGAHPEQGLRACEPLGCFSTVVQLEQWLRANA